MKRIRYRFKSAEIKVIRVEKIFSTPPHKWPKWVRDAKKSGKIVWNDNPTELHYYTAMGACFLTLNPKDWLLYIPCPEYWDMRWEVTGYLDENFRKKIEKF